ncbi:MAG: phosphoribosylglycinamide formyltransferase [Bacillota bacterium]
MGPLRVGVMASGRGTNCQALIDAAESGRLPAQIVVVVSDKPGAQVLERARRHNIPAVLVDYAGFPSKEAYEKAILEVLKQHAVELVCLAGYMRLVGRVLLEAYPNRIMNIHPSLLPAFRGLDGQRQAWEYGVRFSGCTVHFVDEGMDTGPIILQAVVPVLQGDTPETLAERILQHEHQIYVEAVRLFAEGRLAVEGRRVRIKDYP